MTEAEKPLNRYGIPEGKDLGFTDLMAFKPETLKLYITERIYGRESNPPPFEKYYDDGNFLAQTLAYSWIDGDEFEHDLGTALSEILVSIDSETKEKPKLPHTGALLNLWETFDLMHGDFRDNHPEGMQAIDNIAKTWIMDEEKDVKLAGEWMKYSHNHFQEAKTYNQTLNY